MKYGRIDVVRRGGPEALALVLDELPAPRADELRIRVETAGVSMADLLMREGFHPEARRPPFTLGSTTPRARTVGSSG